MSVWAANNQRWPCPVELRPPAELRGSAARRHPLPELLHLEVSWGSTGWPGVCEVQGLERGGVRGGRRARARSPRRLLLGKTWWLLPFSWRLSSLSDLLSCFSCSCCGLNNVMCICVPGKRWSLAPDPFCVPLPGSHPAPCGWRLQPPRHLSWLSLPFRSRSCLLPVRVVV